jgi:GNAT superfamily N-acetyltransferase
MSAGWQVHPLTPDRWADLEALFGEQGAAYGCWCMWWYQTDEQFYAQAGEANRAALHALVQGWAVPGLLGYFDGRPVGWVCVRPRDQFTRVDATPFLAPPGPDPRVWAITCFYIAADARGHGLMERLIAAAVEHAAARGAAAIEAYPIDPDCAPQERFEGGLYHTVHAHVGILSAFARQGFEVIERRLAYRPIVRRALAPSAPGGEDHVG